jgi:hypothetical protein
MTLLPLIRCSKFVSPASELFTAPLSATVMKLFGRNDDDVFSAAVLKLAFAGKLLLLADANRPAAHPPRKLPGRNSDEDDSDTAVASVVVITCSWLSSDRFPRCPARVVVCCPLLPLTMPLNPLPSSFDPFANGNRSTSSGFCVSCQQTSSGHFPSTTFITPLFCDGPLVPTVLLHFGGSTNETADM